MDKEIKTAVAVLLMEHTDVDLSDFNNSWREIFGWVIWKKGRRVDIHCFNSNVRYVTLLP
jgi:hypothetical protein